MSLVPQLIPIEKNNEKRQKEVLINIIKMLTNRLLLNHDKLNSNIDKIVNTQSDDLMYDIPLDNPDVYYSKTSGIKKLFVKLINQKITGIPKASTIGDFLHSHKN